MPSSTSPLLLNRIRMRQVLLMLSIHEHRTLHAAAQQLGMTQSAASKMLHELEAAVGETPMTDPLLSTAPQHERGEIEAQIEQVLDGFFRDESRRADLAGLDVAFAQVAGALSMMRHDDAAAAVRQCAEEVSCFAEADYLAKVAPADERLHGFGSTQPASEGVRTRTHDAWGDPIKNVKEN